MPPKKNPKHGGKKGGGGSRRKPRLSPYMQMAIGALPGWVAGYILMRIGKTIALVLGTSIIVIEIGHIYFFTQSSASMEEQMQAAFMEEMQQKLADLENVEDIEDLEIEEPSTKEKLKDMMKNNTMFVSFLGGMFLGFGSA